MLHISKNAPLMHEPIVRSLSDAASSPGLNRYSRVKLKFSYLFSSSQNGDKNKCVGGWYPRKARGRQWKQRKKKKTYPPPPRKKRGRNKRSGSAFILLRYLLFKPFRFFLHLLLTCSPKTESLSILDSSDYNYM